MEKYSRLVTEETRSTVYKLLKADLEKLGFKERMPGESFEVFVYPYLEIELDDELEQKKLLEKLKSYVRKRFGEELKEMTSGKNYTEYVCCLPDDQVCIVVFPSKEGKGAKLYVDVLPKNKALSPFKDN